MRKMLLILFCCIHVAVLSQTNSFYKEKYRPQFHFTPAIHWTNDPNGLVFYKGEYHLFYQFNPFGNSWGHMSWGHAVSNDLVHWEHLPLAIPEEKDTMIFSGSCVADKNNTSGFATKPGEIPMVAVYTAHVDNRAGYVNQSQHLAYSLDAGRTWTKYNHNPVLDLGKRDFRDPKVFWYEPQQKWVMAAMLPDEKIVQFYSSKNLKQWQLMSTFGPAGDTSGIWECPDLFQAPVENEPGKLKWVFMHSPAPYMQYFVGEFDGATFKNESSAQNIYRPDYGPDYYAAITYNNLPPSQPVSMGWINNWNYAKDIPTTPWKSAMSIPRTLSVKKINKEWVLIQRPVDAIKELRGKNTSLRNARVQNLLELPVKSQTVELELSFRPGKNAVTGIRLAKAGEHFFEIGYDAEFEMMYIDRTKAGNTEFHPGFINLSRYQIPLRIKDGKVSFHIFFDKSIVEIFANDGEIVMTAQLFPDENENSIELFNMGNPAIFETIDIWELRSIW